MRFLKYLVVVLVLLLVVGGVVLWTLPADVAYRQGARYLGPVVLSGVRGTLWNGHADGISVFGRDLGEIDWHMAKSALLRGRMSADVRIQGTDVDAAGTVEREGAGVMTVRDVRFRFPAELFAPVLDIPDLSLLGAISGVVSEATLRAGFIERATGNARWSEAGVSGAAEARFADIVGEFAGAPNGGIAGTAHDDGTGNLAVAATFHATVSGFEAEARLSARNGDTQVQEMLAHVGEPQPDGSSKLVVRGGMFRLY
ncbi:MAG TPA: type II secretion system protein N [Rhodanobacteraceae bacterium]|nr:type II secretion system protein N [Rhodanobacteraceae bacterium]